MPEKTHSLPRRILQGIGKQKAMVAIAFMLIAMLFLNRDFYTSYNLLSLLKSSAVLEILAFGATLPIVCGGCDLSIGGTMCLSGIVAIHLMKFMPMWLAIVLAVLVGGVIGFINGFIIVKQKTDPFIITLGMGILLKGVCQQLTDAHPLACSNPAFMKIANGKVFGSIPNLLLFMIAVFVILHCVLRYTQFGRNCYAIGGDYNVAVYSGIDAVKIKWMTYVICGLVAALGGVLLSSRLNTGSSLYGETTALTVNCGAVVGGTSFAGGIGGIPQTFLGLIVLNLLENCMNLLGINAYVQQVCKGVVIVGIIWADCFAKKRRLRAA